LVSAAELHLKIKWSVVLFFDKILAFLKFHRKKEPLSQKSLAAAESGA
jgi:hypothetical protein